MPGAVILAAPGPSLPSADLGRFSDLPDIIAVTSAFLAVPHAKHVYACDRRWWDAFHGDVVARHPRARRWAMDDGRAHHPGVDTIGVARHAPGFSTDPAVVHGGRNSGYQAMNLAQLLGYSLVLLVGFDMKPAADGRQHFFGEYAQPALAVRSPYASWVPLFRSVPTGPDFRVVNCTPGSALDAFPFGRLGDFVS